MPGCQGKGVGGKEVALEDCVIVYDGADYMSKRYASRLSQAIDKYAKCTIEAVLMEDATEEAMKIQITEFDKLAPREVKLVVKDNTVDCQIGSYYGLDALLDYIQETYKAGNSLSFKNGFEWAGDSTEGLTKHEQAALYSDKREGDHRVMFYNVLWDSSNMIGTDKAAERNILQAEMIGQYMPDVVGMQERNKTKSTGAGDNDFVILLDKYGYKELEVDLTGLTNSGNTLGENCTPIFYRPEVVTPIEAGYLNYVNDHEPNNPDDSKGINWCLFKNNKSGEQYLVVNTHMTFAKYPSGALQAQEADALIKNLLKKYNVPVFLGGDYNSKITQSTFMKYQELGYKEAKDVASVFSSDVMGHHAYPSYWINVDNPKLNIMMSAAETETDFGKSVDHIMLKNADNVEIKVYGVVVDDCTLSGGDHFPMFIDFSMK